MAIWGFWLKTHFSARILFSARYVRFFGSKHQVILDQLMFNWFLGHINPFWGSYIMLTPQNISESIWNGPYPVKRLVVNISNYTMNRLNHPKLLDMMHNDGIWGSKGIKHDLKCIWIKKVLYIHCTYTTTCCMYTKKTPF